MIQSAVAGLISGGAYALLGVCIVLLFRMVGVLNLAQAAIGVFGTYVMLVCYGADVPIPLSVLIGIVVGGIVGGILGEIMSRWFAEAPVQTRSSVTIAMLIGLLTLGWRIFGVDPRPVPVLFGTTSIEIADVVIPMTVVVTIAFAILLALFIIMILKYTRLGILMRAMAERPTAAELLGVPSRLITVGVWTFGGAVSSLALMLIAPTRTPDFTVLSLFILPALGAALLGQFRSFSIAIIGGLGIGIFEGLISQVPSVNPYRQGVSFIVILVALIWLQRKEVWDARR